MRVAGAVDDPGRRLDRVLVHSPEKHQLAGGQPALHTSRLIILLRSAVRADRTCTRFGSCANGPATLSTILYGPVGSSETARTISELISQSLSPHPPSMKLENMWNCPSDSTMLPPHEEWLVCRKPGPCVVD